VIDGDVRCKASTSTLAITGMKGKQMEEFRLEMQEKPAEAALRFVTGPAGSGKTTQAKERIESDPNSAMFTATTGIAAVNGAGVTWWSALRTQPHNIRKHHENGTLVENMEKIAENCEGLVIDEASMLRHDHLDILTDVVDKVSEARNRRFGLELIGDFLQLPPIPDKDKGETRIPWAFEARSWPRFAAHTTRLRTNYRQQDDPAFAEALGALRKGEGAEAADIIGDTCAWTTTVPARFEGTCIYATNRNVTDHNQRRLKELPGLACTYWANKSGRQRSEWENIPHPLELKLGAYVMVLANDSSKDADGNPNFHYCNGDVGHVEELTADKVHVRIVRTDAAHAIGKITRREYDDHHQVVAEYGRLADQAMRENRSLPDGSVWSAEEDAWIRGSIGYLPLRLAWASTVHKSQGLTLRGPVLINLREAFMRSPAMTYVATSRATMAENITFAGTPKLLAERTAIHPEVRQWL
jgi:AAA domain